MTIPKDITVTLTNNYVPTPENEAPDLETENFLAHRADTLYKALKNLVNYVNTDGRGRALITCSECREAFHELGWDCEHFEKCPVHPAVAIARDLVR